MGEYSVVIQVAIEADNKRDAYDSLIAWLDSAADVARLCDIVVTTPAFEDIT